MLRLIKPRLKYKKSFIAGQKEYGHAKKNLYFENLDIIKDFPGFLKKIRDYEKGKNLPKNMYQLLTIG